MSKDLLFEIGLEETPARFVRAAMNQLKERMIKWLDTNNIAYGNVEAYATPRRLAVFVSAVAEKQEDVEEEVKGPARKIALDEQGNWSKAALGFARSQGVEPEQFTFRELGGTEYIYVTKNTKGVHTSDILANGLLGILNAMTFPKNMRWANYDFKFVRPIRWMVALYGQEIVQVSVAGVTAGQVTRGHRFLGSDEVIIPEPAAYKELLREQYVLVDVEERKALIVKQIEELGTANGWHISIKEDLLEEVLFLVETPTALFGTFDESFLSIPQEVLITSMREHQRYFPVLNHEGALLPFFVTVRNGGSEYLDIIAKGNEKVLRARLSDAKFFYEEDQKMAISDALAKLETIVYHEELGTTGDKVRRISWIAERLAAKLQVEECVQETVKRGAAICKFDLVTQMVYEFPELQGVMGQDYAAKAGETPEIANVVFEHYQPRFAGEQAPASLAGAIVSIADKIDTIAGCFSIGIIPTGSQDPYALRRQAAGIVQIVLEHGLNVQLSDIFNIGIQAHEELRGLKRPAEEIRHDLNEFFGLRVKKLLSDELRYDVVDAVISAGFDDIVSVIKRGHALSNTVNNHEDFKTTVESFNRVSNLASKASSIAVIRPEVFVEASEKQLFSAWETASANFRSQLVGKDAEAALQILGELKEPITSFFDSVMVMAEDEPVRNNRLALLAAIDGDLKAFADFSKLVWV